MLDARSQKLLNEYLSKIEEALKNISVSDRSDILLELDGHIKESVEANEQSIDEVLKALGDPLLVANRYLIAKGAKPVPPPKIRWARNITLGFLGVGSLMVIALVLLIKSFTPILSVDEEKGRVTILGGLVDVDEIEGRVSLGKGLIHVNGKKMDFMNANIYKRKIEGEILASGYKQINILAHNGKWDIKGTKGRSINYECKLSGVSEVQQQERFVFQEKDQVNFKLGSNLLTGAKCKIEVPRNIAVNIRAVNGKIEMENMQQTVNAKLKNGKVKFEKMRDTQYFFRTVVHDGVLKGSGLNLNQEKPDGAYSVNIEVDRGKVEVR